MSASTDTMTPEQIEAWRAVYARNLEHHVPEIRQAAVEQLLLCELALDGLRFRVWCDGASRMPGRLAQLLASCTKPLEYQKAIDQFIVETMRTGRA